MIIFNKLFYNEIFIPTFLFRKESLTKRVAQLENQIDGLIQDSLGLLKVLITIIFNF